MSEVVSSNSAKYNKSTRIREHMFRIDYKNYSLYSPNDLQCIYHCIEIKILLLTNGVKTSTHLITANSYR